METNITHDYENHMLFISNMKSKLDDSNHRLTEANFFFSNRSAIQKERDTIIKIIALALIKLDEIISPVQLTELDDILNTPYNIKNRSGSL